MAKSKESYRRKIVSESSGGSLVAGHAAKRPQLKINSTKQLFFPGSNPGLLTQCQLFKVALPPDEVWGNQVAGRKVAQTPHYKSMGRKF
jgi:hypothetical protein